MLVGPDQAAQDARRPRPAGRRSRSGRRRPSSSPAASANSAVHGSTCSALTCGSSRPTTSVAGTRERRPRLVAVADRHAEVGDHAGQQQVAHVVVGDDLGGQAAEEADRLGELLAGERGDVAHPLRGQQRRRRAARRDEVPAAAAARRQPPGTPRTRPARPGCARTGRTAGRRPRSARVIAAAAPSISSAMVGARLGGAVLAAGPADRPGSRRPRPGRPASPGRPAGCRPRTGSRTPAAPRAAAPGRLVEEPLPVPGLAAGSPARTASGRCAEGLGAAAGRVAGPDVQLAAAGQHDHRGHGPLPPDVAGVGHADRRLGQQARSAARRRRRPGPASSARPARPACAAAAPRSCARTRSARRGGEVGVQEVVGVHPPAS